MARLVIPQLVIAMQEELQEVNFYHEIIRKNEADQYLFGPILIADVRDRQGHIYNEREVEKACWSFAANGWKPDLLHKELLGPEDCLFVESFVYRPEVFGGPLTIGEHVYKTAVWFGGTLVGDTVWGKFQKGEIQGYSITGLARYIPEEE
jgi:hypothetical protein